MTDDLSSHDIEELRALMRRHHLLPEVPSALLVPSDATTRGLRDDSTAPRSAASTDDRATAASEAMLARILATPRPDAQPEHAGPRTADGATTRQAPGTGRGPGDRRGRVRRRSALLGVAAATAVVAVVGSQITSTPEAVAGGAPPLSYTLGTPADAWDTTLPSAHDTLVDLAQVADDAADLPRTGDVQHVALYSWESETDADAGTTVVYPTADQRWTAADGSVRVVQRRAEPVTYDGQIDTSAGPSAAGSESTDDLPPATMDPSAVADLPTDPEALGAALRAQVPDGLATGPESDGLLVAQTVVDQYQFAVVPQDVVSGMWSVLADAPSVRLVGETTDRLGRTGVAVAVADPLNEDLGIESVLVLIISPTDGQLLGTETVTLTNPVLDVDEPTVTRFTTITERGWVSAIGD